MLRPGFEPGSATREAHDTISWKYIRSDFITYFDSKRYSARYKIDMLSYLDKNFTTISSPMDIMRCFSKLEKGGRHLWLGFRAVFNFLEATGYNAETLSVYRKALPTFQCGIDLKVPEEAKIIADLKAFMVANPKCRAVHNLLLDSGLRLVEAMHLVNNWTEPDKVGNFYRSEVGMFRGCKQAYFAYYTAATYDLLKGLSSKVSQIAYEKAIERFNLTRSKYLRKFAFDSMVQLEVPESVADFIEGRVPKSIGAKHYMVLRRQADKFYGKYADYLTKLRSKANLAMP